MSTTDISTPPADNELEISVFGPGYGECIVVHLGHGEWLVVDSCIDAASRMPAALTYLSLLGLDPATAIRRVVATHWHDDHVRGIAMVARRAPQAECYISALMDRTEFRTLLSSKAGDSPTALGSGVDEMQGVREALTASDRRALLAVPNRLIWESGRTSHVQVRSLSPSDDDIVAGVASISGLLPAPGRRKVHRIPCPKKNDASVALRIETAAGNVLLGADLEERDLPGSGWRVILRDERQRAPRLANLFKIPHHGSLNGHLVGVWLDLVEPSAVAVLTPFQLGSVLLPQDDDLRRVAWFSENTLVTSPPDKQARRVREALSDRMIDSVARNRWLLGAGTGQVRLRRPFDGPGRPWSIAIFGDAYYYRRTDQAHFVSLRCAPSSL